MSANERPVAAAGATQAQQQGELLASRVLQARGAGLYAYAYRLTLSEASASAALRHVAVTLRSGAPQMLDEQTALEAARGEIARSSVGRSESDTTAVAVPSRLEQELVRTGFHRRLHALPALERQCWLLRHTGGHDVDAIAALLGIATQEVRSALASAAVSLVEGELADGVE